MALAQPTPPQQLPETSQPQGMAAAAAAAAADAAFAVAAQQHANQQALAGQLAEAAAAVGERSNTSNPAFPLPEGLSALTSCATSLFNEILLPSSLAIIRRFWNFRICLYNHTICKSALLMLSTSLVSRLPLIQTH